MAIRAAAMAALIRFRFIACSLSTVSPGRCPWVRLSGRVAVVSRFGPLTLTPNGLRCPARVGSGAGEPPHRADAGALGGGTGLLSRIVDRGLGSGADLHEPPAGRGLPAGHVVEVGLFDLGALHLW